MEKQPKLIPTDVRAKTAEGFTTIKNPERTPAYREGSTPIADTDKPPGRKFGGFTVIKEQERQAHARNAEKKPDTTMIAVFEDDRRSYEDRQQREYRRLGSLPDEVWSHEENESGSSERGRHTPNLRIF
jgi:hypothetical protein